MERLSETYFQERKAVDIKYNHAKSLYDHAVCVLDLINDGHLERAKEFLSSMKSNARYDLKEAEKERERIFDYHIERIGK